MTWKEFWARVGIAAVLTPIIHTIDQHWGASTVHGGWAWVLAAVAALCLVFLGELLWDAFVGNDGAST